MGKNKAPCYESFTLLSELISIMPKNEIDLSTTFSNL